MRTWTGFVSLLAVLSALGGCSSTDQAITKPPPIPPQYVLPPQDETRYSSPPQFPEKTLNDHKKRVDPMMPGSIRSPRQGGGGMGQY